MQSELTQAPSFPIYQEVKLYLGDGREELKKPNLENGIVEILWQLEENDSLVQRLAQDLSKKNKERLILLARDYVQKGLSPEEEGRLEILELETDLDMQKTYEKSMTSLNEFEGYVMNELNFLKSLDEQADI